MKKGILLFFAGSILGAAAVCGVLVLLTAPGESIPPEGEPPVSRPGRKPKFNFDEPYLRKKVKHFMGVTEESFDERIAELDTLKDQAKAGNADALRTLMALADAGICMGEDVVKRLAATGKPEAGEFLLRLTRKPEPRMSIAAVKGLPDVLDRKRTIQEIDMLLTETHAMPHKEDMRAACMEALGKVASEQCIPLAARELSMIDTAADLEYGSQLVALVKAVGNPRAATMLEKYADRLRKKRPKDKLRSKYFDGKIEEVRKTIDALQAPSEPEPRSADARD